MNNDINSLYPHITHFPVPAIMIQYEFDPSYDDILWVYHVDDYRDIEQWLSDRSVHRFKDHSESFLSKWQLTESMKTFFVMTWT